MRHRELQIGLFGTFDVENYGDLLFPLIAEAELTERLGRVKFHRFSYHAKSPPNWPYTVTAVTELPRMAGNLDGVLIGGGFIIRFDKEVAPGYGPPTPAIHHPTGYWLSPALIALQHGIPLIWNAPGMNCNEIPGWADPLMQLALVHSRYIAVRDEPSRAALARFASKDSIAVVPDTAFGISRLLDDRQPSGEFNRLREASGLSGPYIVVQARPGLDSFLSFVRKHSHRLRDFRFLALPVGPALGDHEAALGDELPGLVRLRGWPHPLLLAELIGHAAAVVGYGYHLAITALSFGVPVFSSVNLTVGRYTALSGFETVYSLPNEGETDPHWFITRLGKQTPTPAARAARDQLVQHWDRVAAVLDKGSTGTQSAVSQFFQSLPTLLESATTLYDEAVKASEAQSAALLEQINEQAAAIAALESQNADLQQRINEQASAVAALESQNAKEPGRIGELSKVLALARAEIVARDDRIARLLTSPSWKFTIPARFAMRNLKRLVGK
jgi:lipopolysaccharide transport system ATP-binding protein